jgi:murein DD-endopeptidase MepM/ murein hydrolase activator NlpD
MYKFPIDPPLDFVKMSAGSINQPKQLLMRQKNVLLGITLTHWSMAGILMLIMINPVAAGNLYKYQDEQGNWHFTDKIPENYTPPAETAETAAVPEQVTIQNVGTDEQPQFEVTNNLPGPVELEFIGKHLHNMRATPPLPIHKVIPAGTRQPLTRLEKIQPDLSWSYSYSTRYVIGDPEAHHETGKPYLPPFPQTKEFIISEAFDGTRNHKQHPLTRYAVDIPMPPGTVIFAARSGTVMEIKSGKLSPLRKHATYYLRILHNDGTFGQYAYLDPKSIKLTVGTKVNRGQAIGALAKPASKNATPHLHFAVQKNVGMKLESIPFRFAGLEGSPVEPKTGLRLRHPL